MTEAPQPLRTPVYAQKHASNSLGLAQAHQPALDDPRYNPHVLHSHLCQAESHHQQFNVPLQHIALVSSHAEPGLQLIPYAI